VPWICSTDVGRAREQSVSSVPATGAIRREGVGLAGQSKRHHGPVGHAGGIDACRVDRDLLLTAATMAVMNPTSSTFVRCGLPQHVPAFQARLRPSG